MIVVLIVISAICMLIAADSDNSNLYPPARRQKPRDSKE